MLCLPSGRDVSVSLCSQLHRGGYTSGSDNSRAHAFLITAPLLHAPKSTLCSTNLFLSCQDFQQPLHKGKVNSLFNVKGCRDALRKKKSHTFYSMFYLSAVIPRFGDQNMAATWSRELQGSRTVGRCRSSTPWRATWGRDVRRRHRSWTRTRPSAPSPHFQGKLVRRLNVSILFAGLLWRKNNTVYSLVNKPTFVQVRLPRFH